jgi:hypothetical protein
MHFVNAQQARLIYKYRIINEKLQKPIASIWYSKICIAEQLQPKYIHITVTGNNRRSPNTKNTAVKYRINQNRPAYSLTELLVTAESIHMGVN